MRAATWIKMLLGGGAMCIGGPALVLYVMPSEEELISRYNPELRKRALENRKERQEDFDKFVTRLKEYSKDEKKPIWTVWEEDGEKKRLAAIDAQRQATFDEQKAIQAKKDEIKSSFR